MAVSMLTRSGEAVDVPDEHVADAYASGQFGFADPAARIPVKLADGTTGTVPASGFGDAVASGATVNAEGAHAAEMAKQYGGGTGAALAATGGALETATLGAGDFAVRRIGGILGSLTGPGEGLSSEGFKEGERSAREGLNAAYDLHPYARIAGGIGGIALGGPVTEGVGLLGDLAAQGGERAAAKLGAGALTTKIAGHVARSFAEGVPYGMGNEVSEAELGDHELNAEKLFAGGFTGGVLGAVAGGVVGGALEARAARAALSPAVREAAEGAESALKPAAEVGSAAAKATEAAESSAGQTGLASKLEKIANEQRVKVIDARLSFTKKMQELPGGIDGVGQVLKPLVKAGDTASTVAAKVESAYDASIQRMADRVSSLDAAGIEGPRVIDIANKIQQEVMPDLHRMPNLNKSVIQRVNDAIDDLSRNFGGDTSRVTFSGLREWRIQFDRLVKFEGKTSTALNDAYRTMRGVIEKEIEDGGERGARELGGSFKAEYQADKLNYRRLKVANEAAERTLRAKVSNATLSPSEKGASMLGFVAGMMGHGFGAGAAMSAASTIAAKAMHTYGNAVIADVADRAAQLTMVQGAARSIDERLTDGVRAFFRKEAAKPALRVAAPAKFSQAVEGVAEAATKPQDVMGHVEASSARLAPHAPKTTQALGMQALKVNAYLANHLPRAMVSGATLQPNLAHYRVSDAEKAEFMARVNAAQDPVGTVVAGLRSGRLTRAQVETVRECYPKLYEQTRSMLISEAAASATPLDYKQKLALHLLFGIDTDPSLQQDALQVLQSTIAAAPQTPQSSGGPSPAPKRMVKALPEQASTPFQRTGGA